MLQVGDVIGGRYRIERMLGMGGFGVVAAATHLELRHEVAIKLVRPEFTDDAEIIDRFLREARAVAGLRTEHVCRVFDIGRTEQGTPYIVMELLQGADVASMLRTRPLPPETAVDFVLQACIALAEAHPRGIVHRDLKPPNLFVVRRADGGSLVKVLDFGIAKAVDELRLTHSSVVLGSPQYMSPEQLTTPKDVDPRTDIWSLGVTLYHMLARRLPFPSAQIGELAVMITSQPPAPIDIDPALRDVIFRCLEKRREARFQDVSQLAAALAPFGGAAAYGHASNVRAPLVPAVMSTPPTVAPANLPTVGSMSSMPAPMPAPVPAKSRGWRFAVLAVVLVGGGATVGYLALSSKQSAPPSGAPIVAAAAPDAAKLVVAVDAAVAVDAPPPKPSSVLEIELAKIEGRIGATPPSSPEISSLYMSATQMACSINDIDKAKHYLARIVDAKLKQLAVDACRAYSITL